MRERVHIPFQYELKSYLTEEPAVDAENFRSYQELQRTIISPWSFAIEDHVGVVNFVITSSIISTSSVFLVSKLDVHMNARPSDSPTIEGTQNYCSNPPRWNEEELVKDIFFFSLACNFASTVKSYTLLMLLHADVQLSTKMWDSERRGPERAHCLMMSQL